MAYVTGGLAIGNVRNVANFNPGFVVSESKTRTGWTFGGGIEHMWTRNWTVALEGLYVDLGRKAYTHPADATKTTRFSHQAFIARLKANYKW
jgi:outer membrane immunogenic protein